MTAYITGTRGRPHRKRDSDFNFLGFGFSNKHSYLPDRTILPAVDLVLLHLVSLLQAGYLLGVGW